MIFTLQHPFPSLRGEPISAVTARESVTVADMLAMRKTDGKDEDGVEGTAILCARMCGLDLSELRAMHLADYLPLSAHCSKVYLEAMGVKATPDSAAEDSDPKDG